MSRHLVIGDAHAKANQDLSRFTRLGRFAAEHRPDVIVNIGDWADMEALSLYDKGKKSFEGRKYVADIAAANEALRLFHVELPKGYKPHLISIVGNHEHRISRAVDDAREFEGLIAYSDLDFERRGWEVTPFLVPKIVDGVAYCHYFNSGNTSRPISGEYSAANHVKKLFTSAVSGHSHLLDYARRVDTTSGRTIHGLVAGCYFDETENYAGPQGNKLWARGLCLLNDVQNGEFDFEWWSMRRIIARYSEKLTVATRPRGWFGK